MKSRRRWTREELILALEVYSRYKPRELTKQHAEIASVQQLTGRTADAVYMKLSNFLSIDPDYPGDGLSHAGAADREVWQEFTGRKAQLIAAASDVRRHLEGRSKAP